MSVDSPEPMVLRVKKVPKASRVLRVSEGCRESRVPRATRVTQATPDPEANKGCRDWKGQKVPVVLKARKVTRVTSD